MQVQREPDTGTECHSIQFYFRPPCMAWRPICTRYSSPLRGPLPRDRGGAVEAGSAVEAAARSSCRLGKRKSAAPNDQGPHGAPGETRTPNPLLRRQMLYPVELRAHEKHFTAKRPAVYALCLLHLKAQIGEAVAAFHLQHHGIAGFQLGHGSAQVIHGSD